jgi:hypothetical protein
MYLGAVRDQVRGDAPPEAGAASGDQYPLPCEQVREKIDMGFPCQAASVAPVGGEVR